MSKEVTTLSLILQTPGCLPALIWGDPGIGKSARINQIAKSLDWGSEMYRPAERGEGGLGVVPVPSDDRKVLHYPLPDWAARMCADERPSLLFLDEVSSTPPALQPALMGLVLDGIIAGQRLPARVRRCAAANPADLAAGGWDLAPALANRFIHLEWARPAADEWVAWLTGNSDDPVIDPIDPDLWDREFSTSKALGAAFMRSHTTALGEDVAKITGRFPAAYATPRTWESAIRLLASCRALGRMDLYPMLAQGTLGPTVALEGEGAWLVWLKNNDLPDPEDLLANPGLFKHDPKRPDRTFATLLAVAEAALATTNGKKLSKEKRSERWNRGWSVMKRGLDMNLGKDVVLLPSRVMVDKCRMPSATEPSKDAISVLQVMSGFLKVTHIFGDNSAQKTRM